MIIAYRTHEGKVRELNEDACFVDSEARLFIVADGMGGHQAGEVASAMAVECIKQRLIGASGHGLAPSETLLKRVVMKANQEVYAESRKNPDRHGMGTTLTLALAAHGAVYLAHVGDSRAYLLRGGGLVALTQDHSVIEELVRQGAISREAADHHPYRHMITRSLGTEPGLVVDTLTIRIHEGDRILLCTDGLTNQLSNDEILPLMREGTPEDCAQALLDAALGSGGLDNITAIVAVVEGSDL